MASKRKTNKGFEQWWAELVAALLPLPLGGLSIYLFQGEQAWPAMKRWVAEGMLMPPAALLCVSVLWALYELRKHTATTVVRTMIFGLLLVSAVLFAASVQPPDSRELTTNELFWWNSLTYALVVGACGVVAIWKALSKK